LKAIGIRKDEKDEGNDSIKPCEPWVPSDAIEWRAALKIRNPPGNPKSPANKLFF
jgi:hypothetical protein